MGRDKEPAFNAEDLRYMESIPGVRLQDWMKAHGITVLNLAEDLGIRTPAIYNWLKGKHTPGNDIMFALMVYSRGQVTPRSFLTKETT